MGVQEKLPDRATTSTLVSSPTAANLALIRSSGSETPGKAVFARSRFAEEPSFLPNGTSHEGPPACVNIELVSYR